MKITLTKEKKERCDFCEHWEKIQDDTVSKDMGKCKLLSGTYIEGGMEFLGRKYPKEEYPDTEKTGIESFPICEHDVARFTYTTKSWFGCINFKFKY